MPAWHQCSSPAPDGQRPGVRESWPICLRIFRRQPHGL